MTLGKHCRAESPEIAERLFEMAPFVARGNLIVIGSEVSVLIIDTTTGTLKHASIPPLSESHAEKNKQEPQTDNTQPSTIPQNTNSEDYSHLNMGTCIALSSCGSFLAVCTSDKNLTVWKLSSMDVLKQWKAARKVSSLTFNSDSSQLLVADKAGDCFSYSLDVPNNTGKLILGHLSMLLDVVVSSDNKFIITSERDEKIRVSCLPNAYNIHAYCLGHTEFVTSLAIIQNNLLLSGSGDGTLRVWDYLNGKMLHTENLKDPSDEEMEKAVRTVVVYKASGDMSIAAVLLDRIKTVFLYKITGEEPKFHRQTLPFVAQPLEAAFTDCGSLYVLTDSVTNPIEYFGKDESFTYTLGESAIVGNLLANVSDLKIVQECVKTCNGDLKPLFKRWFDNVQVYRDRKSDQQVKPQFASSDVTSSPKRLRGSGTGDDFNQLSSDDSLAGAVECHRQLVNHFTLKEKKNLSDRQFKDWIIYLEDTGVFASVVHGRHTRGLFGGGIFLHAGVVNGQLRSVCHSTLAVQRHFGRTERHNCPESVEHDLSFAEFYTGIDNALRNKSSITENSWFATNFVPLQNVSDFVTNNDYFGVRIGDNIGFYNTANR
uniref:tRNA (guanine-N(7)-)-methyltransferase non-catalytic subunit n=1 Tax=Daphnia galeata TaxID=27404 RepID=A0A8J2RT09_9CRUS|nr:unnamed protein product [Daphnia galeata]